MNDRITLGAAVWVATISVASLAIRWAVTPVRQPAPYGDDHDTVVTPIDEFMGDWERDGDWEPVYGDALEQARGGRA